MAEGEVAVAENKQASHVIERKMNMSVLVYLVLTVVVFAALGLTLKWGS